MVIAHTGIKRLKRLERIKSGEIKDVSNLPAGAFKSYMDIELNLLLKKSDSVTQFLKSIKNFRMILVHYLEDWIRAILLQF